MPDDSEKIHFLADRGDATRRLDQVLVRRVSDIVRLSRTRAQQWIAAGAVSVDGQVARRPATLVREGATILVSPPDSARRRTRPSAEAGALDILYEDDDLLVLNKPPHIVVHPTYKQTSGTLLNAVLWHVRERPHRQPGILTRLDKDTSGLVVIALSSESHRLMQRDAAAGHTTKEYLAVVCGTPRPRAGRVTLPLARDPNDRRRVITTPTGAASETRYVVVGAARHDGHSVVRCELVTGRTHQIRVHLAACGWPIVGDRAYGTPDTDIARQALHAWRITLPHPRTRALLTLVAPLPADIRKLVGDMPTASA